MKPKGLLTALLLATGIGMMAGCQKESDFAADESLLTGKWQRSGTREYWRFDSSHNGETWDLSDDVHEGEGTPFTWTLEGADVTCVMKGEMGQVVPKVYTLTSQSALSMSWKDNYGNSSSFTKSI